MTAFAMPTAAFVETLEAALPPQQHDSHVRAYDAFVRAYGSMEGFYLEKARQARSRAQLMETPRGRDIIWRQNNRHSDYRRSRA